MPIPYKTSAGEERWRARWRTGNGERQSRSGFMSEAKAREHEEAMRTARRQGQPLRRPKTRMTIGEYWEQWWVEEVTAAKARGTQAGYRSIYAAYIGPRIGRLRLQQIIDDPQLLVDWRARLAREKSQTVMVQAQRVLSSMLSAAAEERAIPHNPVLLLTQQGRRGRARRIARAQPKSEPLAVDLTAWFLVMEHLRRPERPPIKEGGKHRTRRYPLERERDALIVALGFMAGLRLPSEALGLTREDIRGERLHMEGRNSAGEYTPGSKTGPGRDMPLRPELTAVLERVELAYRSTGQPLAREDFWISTREGETWSEHQAHNWREREFNPVTRQVAEDFPQFSDLRKATPYTTRHTFISSCLQAGLSLATIATWCGTSIQMISQTYGRMIRRYEGKPATTLDEQFQAAKLDAMSLLSTSSTTPAAQQGGPTGGPTAAKMLPAKRRRKAD